MRERHHDGSASRDAHEPVPDYSPDGVDRTLIRWMLSLTPTQRLRALQETVASLRGLRLARRSGD